MHLGLQPLPGDGSAVIHVPTSAVMYEAAIEGLTTLDAQILQHLRLPSIYDSGVVYHREPRDVWRHVGDVYKSGWGDCEDLAAWRAAELRVSGEDPAAHVHVYQSGSRKFHAVVARGDDSIEDPSYILGMKVAPGWQPLAMVGEQRYRRRKA